MNKGGVKSPTQITPINSCRHSPLKEVELKTFPIECELHFVTRFRGYSAGGTVGEVLCGAEEADTASVG